MTEGDRGGQAALEAENAVRLHETCRGKIQVAPKRPIRGFDDFAVWYTPGVAAACRAIAADPDRVWSLTNRANSVAVVTDGTRVLGLGDIGPQAGLPVMEGKALLFKHLGGIDAVPLCLGTKDADEIVRTVELLQPSFGGINLEDISQPKCFRVLDRLRKSCTIPVWHDDQQGTALVVLAALRNALHVVGKELAHVRIALVGVGAANVATYRCLRAAGADPANVVACDRAGTLHRGRVDIERDRDWFVDKWRLCVETNAGQVIGGVREALAGADACLAFSSPGPNVIEAEWVRRMAADAIVFACANPVPEIRPDDARAAGARIVATGRSDFPNQVNNSLAFPGVFRGALDVGARSITEEMALAAARALGDAIPREQLREDRIVPRMDDPAVVEEVAFATAMCAIRQGLAARPTSPDGLRSRIALALRRARELNDALAAAAPSEAF